MENTEKSKPLLRSWALFGIVIFNLFIFWLLLFKRGYGANVTIFEIASLLSILIVNKNKSPLFYAKIVIAIILSMFFWIRADFLTDSLSFLTVILLNTVIFQEAITGKLVSASYFIDLPFMSIGKVLVYTERAFKFLFSWQKYLEKIKIDGTKTEGIKKVFVGVLVSLPIIAVLVLLFASADQNFQTLFSGFFTAFGNLFNFSWLNNLNWVFDWIWQFGIFWAYLCLTFPFDESIKKESIVYMRRVVEKTTVVVLVSAIFALFIITQAKTTDYILNGFATGQLNPSTFVREGFYQLVFACIVGMTVFYAVKTELGKRLVTILLLTEIFLVSLVAGERVWLYQYQYGLTQARVWGLLFLLFVLIIIVSLFFDLFKKISDRGLWQILLLGFSSTIILAGLINVDYAVAVIRPPVVNGQVDVTYMVNNLSYDALDKWNQDLQNINPNLLSGCNVQDNPQLCQNILDQFKSQYILTQNLNLFLNNLQGIRYVSADSFDITKFCSNKGDWMTSNLSKLNHTKAVCDNYQNWIGFKNKYDSINRILNPSQINSSTPTPTPNTSSGGYLLCQTVQNTNKGFATCAVDINGIIDTSQSYCESQNTHIKAYLQNNDYGNPRRYYGTLANINPNEEIGVNFNTFEGQPSKCSVYR